MTPEKKKETSSPEKTKEVPATLILLIPANKLSELKEQETASSEKTTQLIDASVYYGCFPQKEAKETEAGMNLKEGEFSRESAQYVYVTLFTKNGQDLIEGSSLKFSMKKSLRSTPREFTVRKIRIFDKGLDGVEKLKRI